MKVIKSLDNTGILIKGSTRKFTSQEGGFLIPLMVLDLPLMKSALTPLAKSVLIRNISRNVSSRCSYSKEHLRISSSIGLTFACNTITNFK